MWFFKYPWIILFWSNIPWACIQPIYIFKPWWIWHPIFCWSFYFCCYFLCTYFWLSSKLYFFISSFTFIPISCLSCCDMSIASCCKVVMPYGFGDTCPISRFKHVKDIVACDHVMVFVAFDCVVEQTSILLSRTLFWKATFLILTRRGLRMSTRVLGKSTNMLNFRGKIHLMIGRSFVVLTLQNLLLAF